MRPGPVEILRGEEGVGRAVQLLRSGEVVAFPTDTVYGLAAWARDGRAVRRVYELKGRSLSQPLILMVREKAAVEEWATVDARAKRYMERWWPGPLTLVLPARRGLRPPVASGSPRTVAFRLPDHPLALELLAAAGEALATTSANRSGEPPALTALEAAWVSGVAAVVDGGRAPGATPSTILDVSGPEPRVLREGPISTADLLEL